MSQMDITICKVLSMYVCLVFRYVIYHMSKQLLKYLILKCPQSTFQFHGLLMQRDDKGGILSSSKARTEEHKMSIRCI
jgi:hypothetical protein